MPRSRSRSQCAGRAEASVRSPVRGGRSFASSLWTRPFSAVHAIGAKFRPIAPARPDRLVRYRRYARRCALHERPRTPAHRPRVTPTSSGCICWSRSGSCSPTSPSPTSCCGSPPATAPAMSPSPRCGPTPAPPPTRTTWSATSSRAAAARCWTPRSTRAGSCARATRSGARRCPVRVESIPVRREGRVLGVIARNTNLLTVRTPSRLELTYLQSASDLAQMIAAGLLPVPRPAGRHGRLAARRRRTDPARRRRHRPVRQPRTRLSAYHRLGLASDLVGHHLGQTTAELAPSRGPVDEALVKLASGWAPREFEVEGNDGVIQLRAIPLKPKGTRIGSLVLLRDVTELRRRERELITKDATIREIHHRVKNNLQTVAALLRLQARRMDSDRGREALERGGTAGRFDRDRARDALPEPGRARRVRRDRRPGARDGRRDLARARSTGRRTGPLRHPGRRGRHPAVHGPDRDAAERPGARLRRRASSGTVEVSAVRGGTHARRPGCWSPSRTTGVGLPEGFDPQRAGNLGLQIVRTLVEGELGGTFDMVPAPERGTQVVLDIPVTRREVAHASSADVRTSAVRVRRRQRTGTQQVSPGPMSVRGSSCSLLTAHASGYCALRLGGGSAYSLYAPPSSGCSGAVVRRWRYAPGCERRGASSRGARPR